MTELAHLVVRLRKALTGVVALRARLAYREREEPAGWNRAGGDVECPKCGLVYFDHPSHPNFHWLTILCDGSLVKL